MTVCVREDSGLSRLHEPKFDSGGVHILSITRGVRQFTMLAARRLTIWIRAPGRDLLNLPHRDLRHCTQRAKRLLESLAN